MTAHYEVFSIGDRHSNFAIERINQTIPSNETGSQRKAHSNHREWPRTTNEVFADHDFQINTTGCLDHKGRPVKLRRIYELYDREFPLFDSEWTQQTLVRDRSSYPSFVAEFIMLDLDYAKTLFFQKNLSQVGYYQYFVRRNGEYHVGYVDDSIPVDNDDQEPLWGLRREEPWKLILMKAWIKEKGGIQQVISAEPFEFIEAFGVPGYRALSIRKEMDHLRKSRLKEQTKKMKTQKIPFHDSTYLIVGKTRDSEKINQMGLMKNRAAYQISELKAKPESALMSTLKSSSKELFKVKSSIPSRWCGEYSILSPNFNKDTVPISQIKIETEFIITYDELVALFSKFYAIRQYCPEPVKASSFKQYKSTMVEDSYVKRITNQRPHFFYDLVIEREGLLNINIEVPFSSASVKTQDNMVKKRYTPMKILIGRYFTEEEKLTNKNKEMEIIEYYDGQNVKGYHKNLNRFVQLIKGKYVIYFKVDNSVECTDQVVINISGNAQVSSFKELKLEPREKQQILKSILFRYAIRYSIRTYTSDKVKDRIIYLGNSFDQLGFGIAAVTVDSRSQFYLGMKVHVDKLRVEHLNMDICREAHGMIEEQDKNESTTLDFLDKGNDPKIVILEKLDRRSYANEVFPPDGTINFFEVYDKPKSAIK